LNADPDAAGPSPEETVAAALRSTESPEVVAGERRAKSATAFVVDPVLWLALSKPGRIVLACIVFALTIFLVGDTADWF
jgi:hypothetical protein